MSDWGVGALCFIVFLNTVFVGGLAVGLWMLKRKLDELAEKVDPLADRAARILGRVEEPRFEAMIKTPDMFEKYLPYAMALGVEKRWVAAFDDICKQPPDWYRGSSYAMFRPSYFVSDMNRMTTSMASTMASSPRSSGGSGFGGGGGGTGGGICGGVHLSTESAMFSVLT